MRLSRASAILLQSPEVRDRSRAGSSCRSISRAVRVARPWSILATRCASTRSISPRERSDQASIQKARNVADLLERGHRARLGHHTALVVDVKA
jgi:hypothetical protein